MPKKTGWIFLALGAAVLAALFVVLKPDGAPPGDAPAAGEAPRPPQAPGVPVTRAAGPQIVELRVKEGRLESGPAQISVRQGDEVLIRLVIDRIDELHLHGYDLSVSLQPGIVAELRFVADRAGRFEYELHHAHVELGALEVHPR